MPNDRILEWFARFFHGMLERGIYLPPSQPSRVWQAVSHGDEEIENGLPRRAKSSQRCSFSVDKTGASGPNSGPLTPLMRRCQIGVRIQTA